MNEPAKLSEQTDSTIIIETKADVAKAMEALIKRPESIGRIQAEITAVYRSANVGRTREERKAGMDQALADLASRAVLSDLMVTLLTNGLPEGVRAGPGSMISVKT